MFKWQAKVRDYEVDYENIVHHSNYLCYFEQCRSEYVKSLGLDLLQLHQQGFDVVIKHVDLEYKFPLRAGEDFEVQVVMRREGRLKIMFDQEIYRVADQKLIAQLKVTTVCIDSLKGRPCMPEALERCL